MGLFSRYRRSLIVVAMVVGATASYSGRAVADDRDSSRAAFRRGVLLAKENNYVAAREAFAEAYRLFPHPSILLNLGIARFKTGEYVAAEQDLTRFLSDDGGAPPDEVKNARQMLADTRDRLGTLSLHIKTPGAKATLDGKPVAFVPGQPSPIRAVAGEHALHVEADGYAPHDERLDMLSKIETPVVIQLTARPSDGPSAPAAPGATTNTRATVGWVLVGTGVALAGGAAFCGLRSFSKASDYNALETREEQDASNLKSQGTLYANVADVLTVGAIAAAGVGAYLLLVKPTSTVPTRASLLVGPSFSGLVGSF